MSEELEQVVAWVMMEYDIPFEKLSIMKILHSEDGVMHTIRFNNQTFKTLWQEENRGTEEEWKIIELK
jgi:hypothetical protein